MNVVAKVFRFPAEQNRFHVFLTIVIQAVALLALVTVVRDHRPDPAADSSAWESMGMFAEFSAIVPIAILFVFAGVAGWNALDGQISCAARASLCASIVKWLALGVALTTAQLAGYGFWKGIWEFFGPMAAIGPLNLILSFLVLRLADSGESRGHVRHTATNGSK